MLQSTLFWYFVAVVIFFGLLWWRGRKAIVSTLDKRIEECTAKIADARNLREEALEQYEQAKKENKRSRGRVAEITATAQSECETLLSEAASRRRNYSQTRLEATDYRIRQQRSLVMQNICHEISVRSLEIAEESLAKMYDKKRAHKRTDKLTKLVERL